MTDFEGKRHWGPDVPFTERDRAVAVPTAAQMSKAGKMGARWNPNARYAL